MPNMERYEKRYFFSSTRLPEILSIIRNIVGKEIVNKLPVTETIYFNLERGTTIVFPRGLRVRARRYIEALTPTVIIDRSFFFLEIKRESGDGTNNKKRIMADGLQIVNMLSEPNIIDGLPKLVAYVATQSLRYHWSLEDFGRLTLDADIKLFGFEENQPLKAEYICDFGEGKLEFKIKSRSQFSLESQVIEATRCVEHDHMYLERKTMQCMKMWFSQKPS